MRVTSVVGRLVTVVLVLAVSGLPLAGCTRQNASATPTRPLTPLSSPSVSSVPPADTPSPSVSPVSPASPSVGAASPTDTPSPAGTPSPSVSTVPPADTPSPSVSTVPPADTPSPSVGTPSTTPTATPPVGPQPTVPGRTTTATPGPKPVTFQQVFRYPDGLTVEVSRVKRYKQKKSKATEATPAGAAVQKLTLKVRNATTRPLSLFVLTAQVTYGPKHRVAVRLPTKKSDQLSGLLLPGATRTGIVTFDVPKKHINDVRLMLRVDDRHPAAQFVGSLDYTPKAGVSFNDPTGSKAEQFEIITHVERSIKAAPKGSTIRIAHYSFDVNSSAKALIAAHKRGVRVQMIVDQHEGVVTSETRRLRKELGHNRHKKSFLIRCKASCMSSRKSAMHAKFYLFSRVGGATDVSMVSSANLTHTNSENSWNDLQTIVGDRGLYDSLGTYFKDMAPDKNRRNYFRTSTSGIHKLYLYPRKVKKASDVVVLQVLKNVTCNGASPGFGGKGRHTVVRVGMYSWTSDRIDIARALFKLQDQGCIVQVIYNSARTTRPVASTLLRRSKEHGRLALYDAWRDHNLNDKPERYMHEKLLTINGVWFGRPNTKIVYSGSQNFTPNATEDNNDIIFRTSSAAIYDAYADNFKSIRKHARRGHWSPRVRPVLDLSDGPLA